MRIRSNLRGTKGFVLAWERLIRFKYMITEKAKKRTRILAFWEKHGDGAAKEAFMISRRTLYRWQEALRREAGKLQLPSGRDALRGGCARGIQELSQGSPPYFPRRQGS